MLLTINSTGDSLHNTPEQPSRMASAKSSRLSAEANQMTLELGAHTRKLADDRQLAGFGEEERP